MLLLAAKHNSNRILKNNINLVTELAETLYQASLHNGKGNTPV
ncbi:hypothetical protein GPUN_1681 [Glaciecola punicea ACAM 611]|uniref:Uncharacterized protein n=1 Tax=Glaciecola punicea ACAM 611 TaxID=1121923 RepID=H5TBX0_9ALTE|nr:hypothetical protein GPUN_1681 [Glaciecola punicea ACAM 611]